MRRKILIVDHDAKTLNFVSCSLEQGGYDVVTATNGLDGFRLAQEEGPALVVQGVMLPGMDGFELCHRLRSAAATAELPIMLLAPKDGESERGTGQKAGASAYLARPVAPDVLVETVGSLLGLNGTDQADGAHPVQEHLRFVPGGVQRGERAQ